MVILENPSGKDNDYYCIHQMDLRPLIKKQSDSRPEPLRSKEVFRYGQNTIVNKDNRVQSLTQIHARSGAQSSNKKHTINQKLALFFVHEEDLYCWFQGMRDLKHVSSILNNRVIATDDDNLIIETLCKSQDSAFTIANSLEVKEGQQIYFVKHLNIAYSSFVSKDLF